MMRNKRSRWVSGIGAAVLTGGVLMASAGLGVTVAALLWFVDPAGAIPLESWDDKIPLATNRFRVLPEFNGEAVLDRETQLVWERSPSTTFVTWNEARSNCISNKSVGGRKGWRLPSIPELASLLDPNESNPVLPTGHPFMTVQSANYWSAATAADDTAYAWGVNFGNGDVHIIYKSFSPLPFGIHAWCVRGGMNADVY